MEIMNDSFIREAIFHPMAGKYGLSIGEIEHIYQSPWKFMRTKILDSYVSPVKMENIFKVPAVGTIYIRMTKYIKTQNHIWMYGVRAFPDRWNEYGKFLSRYRSLLRQEYVDYRRGHTKFIKKYSKSIDKHSYLWQNLKIS